MGKSRRRLFIILGLLAAMIGHPALAADDCHALLGFHLDLVPTDKGYLVPISLNGTPHFFLLEMSDAYAKIDTRLVDALKLRTMQLPPSIEIKAGKIPLKRVAIVPIIQLGPAPRKDTQFLVEDHQDAWGPRADGVVGMNVFYGLDIELDLAHNKLGLFLPKDCPFTPYWPYDVVGTADFVSGSTGVFLVPMKLNGTNVDVSLMTSAMKSYMPLGAARMLLGIDGDNKELVPAGKSEAEDDLFRYPFRTLMADNVTISNPEIYIYRNKETLCAGQAGDWYHGVHDKSRCFGAGDVMLGIHELRQLHFYFAFKDKKIYFTAAEPAPGGQPSVSH